MEIEQTPNHDYRAAYNFLYSFVNYERDSKWKYDNCHFDLKRVHELFEALESPHKHGWFVHIAGTNGKGSIAAMIANTLTRTGLRTGLYTSPHLMTLRERIRVDGYMITPGEVVASVGRIRPIVDRFRGLTFFEVWTALAFDYFAYMSVDTSVIEVGMGGRLDTTNVITPAVSVISSISLDHCGKLGTSLAEVAGEKAGIIKPGVPVVSAPQEPEVLKVLEKRARDEGTKIIVTGRDVTCKNISGGINYRGLTWSLDAVSVPLNGSLQLQNAAVALTTLEILASDGCPVEPVTAREGIQTVQWPGRLQTISTNPEIVVDGACNTGAMHKAVEFISARRPRDKTVAVVAICKDKEVSKVLAILGTAASCFVLTQVDNPRAMDVQELAERTPENVNVIIETNIDHALRKAVACVPADGLIIITGSLYLVGEVFRHYGIEKFEKI